MFTLTVYLIQRGLISDMFRAAPPGMPNVFMLDIPAKDHQAVFDLLKRQPGAERPPELMGTTAAKLVRVKGTPIEEVKFQGYGRRFRSTRQVTSLGEQPPYAQIDAGRWWSGTPAQPQVCASDDAARILKLAPGDELSWTMSGRTVTARVACVTSIDSIHLAGRMEFIFSAGALDGLPVIYYGSVRMKRGQVAGLQLAMYEKFPNVTVVNVADVLRIVQEVVDQISIVVRFISAFAILAGLIILASSVAGTRFRRVRETVILKTLGATRAKVAGIFSMEFLILGVVAGIMGSLLATGFSSLVLNRLLNAGFPVTLVPQLVAVVATALVANAAGWLASFRILGQKPLQVLREE
jgi:putative ABC transport system permease protein